MIMLRERENMDKKLLAKSLAYYSVCHLNRSGYDQIYLENLLLHRFHELEASHLEIDKERINKMEVPDEFIKELSNISDDLNFPIEIMGLLTPSPSEVIRDFWNKRSSINPSKALDNLYNLQIKNYYIQKTAIDKNVHWFYHFENNYLEITINLSKPEKNNKDIATSLKKKEEIKYPQCILCKENIGYSGNQFSPARENIRVIPVTLNQEKWFLQFSPYCYYYQHVIVINEEHTPMHINKDTFKCLCDFVELFPEYFLGSNSDLPIVGGSILSHEHYQGGKHKMPIMSAPVLFNIPCQDRELKVDYLDWLNSCIRLQSTSKEKIVSAMDEIRSKWYQYSDKEVGIIAYTNERHNAITPILCKEGNEFIAYVILRNNRCDETYPDGIFHSHPEFHSIKKEGIGLIEAMGLLILPGRLKRQMGEIAYILSQENHPNLSNYFSQNQDMIVHKDLLERLYKLYPNRISLKEAQQILQDEISQTCYSILENTAVFKKTNQGIEHAKIFLKALVF